MTRVATALFVVGVLSAISPGHAGQREEVAADSRPIASLQPVDSSALPSAQVVDGALDAVLADPLAECSSTTPRTADVTLAWQVELPLDAVLQVQLSKLREGFEVGDYLVSQDLPGDLSELVVEAPEPGVVYRWRLALLDLVGGLLLSDVGRFQVPICPGDGA